MERGRRRALPLTVIGAAVLVLVVGQMVVPSSHRMLLGMLGPPAATALLWLLGSRDRRPGGPGTRPHASEGGPDGGPSSQVPARPLPRDADAAASAPGYGLTAVLTALLCLLATPVVLLYLPGPIAPLALALAVLGARGRDGWLLIAAGVLAIASPLPGLPPSVWMDTPRSTAAVAALVAQAAVGGGMLLAARRAAGDTSRIAHTEPPVRT
ncbi:hypothetical protein [Cellulomonas taurus]|uniref:hypothetical protein n=1 Tax=Cellulomonas taurus TaxID=2729175 RepID=UPI00145E8172|nr:hypothetical protein [Cellulomonas taurus]